MFLEEDEDCLSDSFATDDIDDESYIDKLLAKVGNLRNEVSNREEVLKECSVS